MGVWNVPGRHLEGVVKVSGMCHTTTLLVLQNNFGTKNFRDPNFFGTKNLLDSKKFLSQIFWTQIFLDLNFLGPKIFLDPKFFGPNIGNFLDRDI